MTELEQETEAYLAKIRKTVEESKALMEQAELRLAETDRLLAQQGLTREQVRGFCFTEEQKAVVNEELKRRGMEPLDFSSAGRDLGVVREAPAVDRPAGGALDACDAQGDVENRRRKFTAMMGAYRL